MPAYCVPCMCYQIKVSAADRSLVQRSPTEYDMAECDPEIEFCMQKNIPYIV